MTISTAINSANSASSVGLVYNPADAEHAPSSTGAGSQHIERPERTQKIWEGLVKSGLCARCDRITPREATRAEAELCHTAEHCDALDALEHALPRLTPLSRRSLLLQQHEHLVVAPHAGHRAL